MTQDLGYGVGDDPVIIKDTTFTDDGYMIVGGQLIDLNDIKKKPETTKPTEPFSIFDWPYS